MENQADECHISLIFFQLWWVFSGCQKLKGQSAPN